MQSNRLFSLLAMCALPGGCAQPPINTANNSTVVIARGDLSSSDGSATGTVSVSETAGELSLTVTASNLPEGKHGFHLHQTGRCDTPDFKTAGGHLNPLGKAHGSMSANGAHLGDLPNLTVDPSGNGQLTAALPGTNEQVAAWLFDTDGTAVVIHAGADDYQTDPSGNAGSRIACAILKPA